MRRCERSVLKTGWTPKTGGIGDKRSMRIVMDRHLVDVLRGLQESLDDAFERSDDSQRQVKPGDFVLLADPTDTGCPARYAEILDPKEIHTPQEWSDFGERHYRNMPAVRVARVYSEQCRTGEIGDVFIDQVADRLSKEGFERARERGWPAVVIM